MTEQVICVDDSLPEHGGWWGDPPVRGDVYTVRVLATDNNGVSGYLFYEIQCRSWTADGEERGYLSSRFRPIKDESLDVFRSIDNDVFREMVDA